MDLTPTRILLIEDNPGDALLVQEALREKEGNLYPLEKVDRLQKGLDRLAKGELDVVLLDLFLPDSFGLATLRTLLDAAPQVPVVVLTGMADKATAVKALQEGAQDFLVKDGLEGNLLKRSISYAIERYRLVKRAQEHEERYFLAAMGSHDGLWDWNLKANQIYFSPRWKMMLGYRDEEIGSAPSEWLDRVHPKDLIRVERDINAHLFGRSSHYANEHRLRHRDGRYRWVFSRGLATMDAKGRATRIAGSFTDITRHKNMEQQLALRAFYDPLTGLPNRTLFIESLARAWSRLERHPLNRFALFFIDLDGFKGVNDRLGHQAGDALLMECAQRLKSSVRPNDLVGRMGGDEFTVLLEDVESQREAVEVAVRILVALGSPFSMKEGEAAITASIGIAYSDCGERGSDGLLRAADEAMYQAKNGGKGRYVVYMKTLGSVSS